MAACVLALVLLASGIALCVTCDVDGYILDPNWYAHHPQLTSPQVLGTGMYEYGIAGSRGGDEGAGFYASTESSVDNNFWGIYGYFRKPNMNAGDWTLASWSRWWRPAFLFQVPYPWTIQSKALLRLHANMWSYGASWPGNTYTPYTDAGWNEIGQTFVATGSSVTLIDIRCPYAGVNWTASVLDGGPTGAPIGPSKSFTSPSGPSDVRLFWNGGELPTVPGHTYYLKLKASGTTTGLFCENEPTPDMSDAMPNGCLYRNGVAIPSRDLGVTICSDDDGIVTNINIDKAGTFPVMTGAVGQTFIARGTSLLYFAPWFADHSTDYVATVYDGISGGTPGPKVGFAKQNSYVRYGDPQVVFVWQPNEVPLTPGHTYYIEVTRASGGQLQFIGTSSGGYAGGEAYANRMLAGGWDMSACMMEEASPGSAMQASVRFLNDPQVAMADRGTRSITVRWDTDVSSDTTIEYGPWNANYTNVYYDSSLATSHVATITGLDPNTMYHFRVKCAASFYKAGVTRDLQTCTINETANLLGNPSFETVPAPPPTHHRVIGAPWVMGGMSAEAGDGAYFNSVPPYDGAWFLEPAVNGGSCNGWLYQTVPATPGVKYNFTAALYSVMKENSIEKYDVWYADRRLDYMRIGIDPTGGTDPTAPSVQWTPTMYSQQHWTNVGTQATATANNITVFVSYAGITTMPNAWHIFGVDDCRLSAVSPAPISIAQLKGSTPDGPVSVNDLIITAVPGEAGAYYAENADRTEGIRIVSSQTVDVGTRVGVTGTLTTDPQTHERYIAGAAFISTSADSEPRPLFMQCKNVGGAAFGTKVLAVPGSVGPHNTGLAVRIAGKVMAKDPGGSAYIWVNDGSISGNGIKVDTSHLSSTDVPNVNDDVAVSGVSSVYLDGVVKPMLIARRASDIN